MPTHGSHPRTTRRGAHLPQAWCAIVAVLGVLCLCGAAPAEPISVRSQRVALYYHFQGAGPATKVELWYTRDRGATWHKYGVDPDGRSPMIFKAPAEGLYGFILIARDAARASAPDPKAHDPAQRWVFIDYTPPLLQWQAVEPCEDFARRRIVRLSWTAYDDHLPARPIRLAYQDSIDQRWIPIGTDLPNTGRYDWTVPAGLQGQIMLKISVRDRGGHVVERLYGPLRPADWLRPVDPAPSTQAAAEPSPAPATQPAAVPATRPSVDALSHNVAEQRYKQGSWHLLRGQYDLAAERFREAIELDPTFVPALNDLAGVYYLKQDYTRAIELYQKALTWDGRDRQALRGAALAYVARRDYARSREMLRRLLALDDRNAEALLDLGDVLFMMGDRPGAIRTWTRALKADPSAAEVIHKARQRLHLYEASPSVASGKGQGETR